MGTLTGRLVRGALLDPTQRIGFLRLLRTEDGVLIRQRTRSRRRREWQKKPARLLRGSVLAELSGKAANVYRPSPLS